MKPTSILFLCSLAPALPLHAQSATGDYVRNGNFDAVTHGQLADWKVTTGVQPEAASGVWKHLSANFRTHANRKVTFSFAVPRGTSGSVWIDHFQLSPGLQMANPSFEDATTTGDLPGWKVENGPGTLFADKNLSSDGNQSLRITKEYEAVPDTRIWQDLTVEPDHEYSLSFDMFIGEDFQGEAKGWLFNAAGTQSLDFDYENLIGSKLVDARDRLGKFSALITPPDNSPVALTQDITVPAGANLQATFDVDNADFTGTIALAVQDLTTGALLKRVTIGERRQAWQTAHFSFQSASAQVRLQITATGSGPLRVDNVTLSPPRVSPPLQSVQWLPGAQNFAISPILKVSVQGESGAALQGALNLLAKDLKPWGAVVERVPGDGGAVGISIGPRYGVKDKGDEAYTLAVTHKNVQIQAPTESGAFYGIMTLLQLLDSRDGAPVFLSCDVVDYPDLPLRGFLYIEAEKAARLKMNTLMVSSGYPVTPSEKQSLRHAVQECQSLNLRFMPMFMTMTGGYYVESFNPNLAAGIWVKNESIELHGNVPAPLAHPYVIRTGLSDIVLKSADGAHEYQAGKDYQVLDGEMSYNYSNPKAAPFRIARLEGSTIPDGGTVLASYDSVSHHRQRDDLNISYVPLEPQAKQLMDDFLTELAREFPFTYINAAADLHEFDVPDLQLQTDSRVIKSGRQPIDLLVENALAMDRAIKRGNPTTRLVQWTGNIRPYTTAAAPRLPKDALVNIWGYDANWPVSYGRDAIAYWSKLGFETSVMPWDNLRNVQGFAQIVAEARGKGYPCLGIIGSAWDKREGGFQETANVSWKVPKPGEKGYVALPATKVAAAQG